MGEAVLLQGPLECVVAFQPGHWAGTTVLAWHVAWASGSVQTTLAELRGKGDKTLTPRAVLARRLGNPHGRQPPRKVAQSQGRWHQSGQVATQCVCLKDKTGP